MRFRSIQTKTLLLILPALILIVIGISVVVFIYARSIIMEEAKNVMKEQLRSTDQSIENRLIAHSRVVESLGKTVGGLYADLTLDQYNAMFAHNLEINPDTFGLGIFFEPNQYKANIKYFSSYAYHGQNQIVTTQEYNDPAYNYPGQPWYTIAVGKKDISYTDPYYDKTTDVTMLTAALPIFTPQKQFLGVVTGDISLTTVQKAVRETKVGSTGWSFMINRDGTYLAGPDKEKIMKTKLQEDSDPALASLGKTLLQQKSGMGLMRGRLD